MGLFSAQLGRTAAWLRSLPRTPQLPPSGGPGGGGGGGRGRECPPGSAVEPDCPETFSGAEVAVREGTPVTRGLLHSPPSASRKLKLPQSPTKFLVPSICHSYRLQIYPPWESRGQPGDWPPDPLQAVSVLTPCPGALGALAGNIAARSCGIVSVLWDRRLLNGSRSPLDVILKITLQKHQSWLKHKGAC